MPLQIVRNDITKVKADAIVNTANQFACVGYGVDFRIYEAAGYELLLKERKKIGTINPGECKATSGFNLACKYIIHTVSMEWKDGNQGEEQILRNCYKNSLAMAEKLDCHSVALPLMATGNNLYPRELAIRIAQEEIEDFLKTSELQVILVVFNRDCLLITQERFDDIKEYINSKYVMEQQKHQEEISVFPSPSQKKFDPHPKLTIEKLLKNKGETFTQMVLRIMEEKRMKPSEVYTGANIDRKVFSKLKNNVDFHPNKNTAVSLSIGLKLSLQEAQDLLVAAGYSFSHGDRFDIVVMYCLERKIYNLMTINEYLFDFNLGGIGQGEKA